MAGISARTYTGSEDSPNLHVLTIMEGTTSRLAASTRCRRPLAMMRMGEQRHGRRLSHGHNRDWQYRGWSHDQGHRERLAHSRERSGDEGVRNAARTDRGRDAPPRNRGETPLPATCGEARFEAKPNETS